MPPIFMAGAVTHRPGNLGGICVQLTRLQNSRDSVRAEQAEVRPDLVIVQAREVRPGPFAGRFPQGSRLVRLNPSDRSPDNLTPGLSRPPIPAPLSTACGCSSLERNRWIQLGRSGK